MSYRNKSRDAAIADDYLVNFIACPVCNVHTDREQIMEIGRCRSCYTRYCNEINSAPMPRTAEERKAVMQRVKDVLSAPVVGVGNAQAALVAKRLRAWEGVGKQLTEGQRWVLSRCEAMLNRGAA